MITIALGIVLGFVLLSALPLIVSIAVWLLKGLFYIALTAGVVGALIALAVVVFK